jgi:hypothetical protein
VWIEAEKVYRTSYIEAVLHVVNATSCRRALADWLVALERWAAEPADPCPFQGDTWQHKRVRGYSQGVEAAQIALKLIVSDDVHERLMLYRDDVLAWRRKNRWRTRSKVPAPPKFTLG